MINNDAPEPTSDIRRYELIAQLEKLGPRLTTRVVVNGRTLLLDAAIRLVEHLPPDAMLGRRGVWITIDPDPFANPTAAASPAGHAPRLEELARMLARLIERQDETDRQAEAEHRGRSWRQRLARLLTGLA